MKSGLPPPFLLDDVPQHHLGPTREGDISHRRSGCCGPGEWWQPAGTAPVPGRLRGKRGGRGDAVSPSSCSAQSRAAPRCVSSLFLSRRVGTLRCLRATVPWAQPRLAMPERAHSYTRVAQAAAGSHRQRGAARAITPPRASSHPGSCFAASKPGRLPAPPQFGGAGGRGAG